MEEKIINCSPHLHCGMTIKKMMYTFLIACLPIAIGSIIFWGLQALLLMFVCIISCILTEFFFNILRKKEISIKDGSAIITGLLLAFVLPPRVPIFVAIIGSVVAIGLGKQIFGGLGYNIFNPALLGRAFLMAAFPVLMTTWYLPITSGQIDTITTATPLSFLKFKDEFSIFNLFIGNRSGCLGETSCLLILITGIFLLLRKIIDWRIPLSYLSTVVILGGLFWLIDSTKYYSPLYHLLSGGLMLGAFFMATDLVTTPYTKLGRFVFGIGAGIILIIIRLWGGLPEGVMYSILFMNAFTPLINQYTRPKIN